MSSSSGYNAQSPSVRRLMTEMRDMARRPSADLCARPVDDNLFEWHFTLRGADDSDYAGGVYHGRILLPSGYPLHPPHIVFLTPNGRFEVGAKICLSASAHHPDQWNPAWSVQTLLLALRAFMPTPGLGAVGAIESTPSARRELAEASRDYVCPRCGLARALLPTPETVAAAAAEAAASSSSPSSSSATSSPLAFPVVPELFQVPISAEHPSGNATATDGAASAAAAAADSILGKEKPKEDIVAAEIPTEAAVADAVAPRPAPLPVVPEIPVVAQARLAVPVPDKGLSVREKFVYDALLGLLVPLLLASVVLRMS
jgi:ubiquitin-protein ligase